MEVSLLEGMMVPYQENQDEGLQKRVFQQYGISLKEVSWCIYRRSLDTRQKKNIHYLYHLIIFEDLKKVKKMDLEDFPIPQIASFSSSPVVVGFGPAGIFASLYLARAGLKPIILEMGEDVENRQKTVEEFWKTGLLQPFSNVQFGEGGAGTFSDGKLTSRSKDPVGRHIAQILVDHGAPSSILFEAKAHIGSDKLIPLVKSIREEIQRLGGTIHFLSQMVSFEKKGEGYGVTYMKNHQKEVIQTQALFLAIGHSSRSTFHLLHQLGFPLEPKPFAVGMRIEHPQEIISRWQYGPSWRDPLLPTAEYILKNQVEDRGCFSFCMCPGGEVVQASSEYGQNVVNGMSLSQRKSSFANSALIVSVKIQDYFKNSPLDGVFFQEAIEKKAWNPHYEISSQLLEDALKDKKTFSFPQHSIRSSLCSRKLQDIFPSFIWDTFLKSLDSFEKQIPGFISSNPLLLAPETRTSSPLRILRNEQTKESVSFAKVYPCGEGAGYAGGIMSSAIDGWRSAEAFVKNYLSSSL